MRTAFIYLFTIITISCNSLSNNNPSHFIKTLGPGVFNEFNVVLQTKDEGYIAAGITLKKHDPNIELPNTDILIAKFDRTGNVVKSHVYDLSKHDNIDGGVLLSKNGNILLLGGKQNNNGVSNALLLVVDVNGDTVKTKRIDSPTDDMVKYAFENEQGEVELFVTNRLELIPYNRSRKISLLQTTSSLQPIKELIAANIGRCDIQCIDRSSNGTFHVFGRPEEDATCEWIVSSDSMIQIWPPSVPHKKFVKHLLRTNPTNELIITEPVIEDMLSVWHVKANDTQKYELKYDLRTDLISLKQYNKDLYLLGLMTTYTGSKYYQYQLELRSIATDSLVWRTSRPLAESTVMMHDIIVTADSGFAVVGMQDVPGKGSKAFIQKLPKPDIFGSNEAF